MTLAIPNLRKSRKRRLLAFVAFFVLLLGLERVPVWLMSVLLGYPFETHPLHMPYEQFTFLLNGGLVLLAVLAELRNARALLPRLFALLLGLLLFCLWSAIWLFFGERHSTFAFQLSMWHMLCGRLATPLLVLYVLDHVVTWWPTASPSERFWGKRLIVAVGVVIGIGALFTVLGGPDERYVLVLHRYGAWFLPGLVLWHTVMVRRGRLGDAVRAEPRADRPRPWTRGRILFGVGLSFAIALGPLALAEGWWTRPLPRITRFIEPLPTLRFREEDPPRTTGSDVGPFRPAPSGTVSGKLREPVFMQQAEGCGYEGCHTDIAKMWAVSAHRHSMNVFVERVMDRLVEERGIAAARYCAGCHDPVGLLAGKYRAGEVPVRGIENEGVTCLVCHATVHVADPARNGSWQVGPTPLFFERAVDRSRYLMTVLFLDDHAAELQHRVLFQRPEFCGACHTHSVPSEVNPAQPLIDDKIAEWRAGMYGPRGDAQPVKTCLGCHMPDTIESYQTEEVPSHRFQSGNTGLAAIYGRDPRYDEFASRYFLGIQQAKFTHAEAVTLAQQVLTRGIVTLSVSVESAPVSLPGELRLRTSVRNQGVGHDFPAGPADLVEVWLQVEVHDSRGSLVWSSGVPSEDGTLPADSYRFGEAWYDAEGRRLRHHEAWRLAEVRERRRVPSGGVDRGRFEFLVAPDISGPLKVQVRLRHRRLSPEFTRWVLGASSEVLPVTDLQLASLEVSLPLAARGGGSP